MAIPDYDDPSAWKVEICDYQGIASCGRYRALVRFRGGGPLRLVWAEAPDAEPGSARLQAVVREACYRALGAGSSRETASQAHRG